MFFMCLWPCMHTNDKLVNMWWINLIIFTLIMKSGYPCLRSETLMKSILVARRTLRGLIYWASVATIIAWISYHPCWFIAVVITYPYHYLTVHAPPNDLGMYMQQCSIWIFGICIIVPLNLNKDHTSYSCAKARLSLWYVINMAYLCYC